MSLPLSRRGILRMALAPAFLPQLQLQDLAPTASATSFGLPSFFDDSECPWHCFVIERRRHILAGATDVTGNDEALNFRCAFADA
jgi:hypothetical protein